MHVTDTNTGHATGTKKGKMNTPGSQECADLLTRVKEEVKVCKDATLRHEAYREKAAALRDTYEGLDRGRGMAEAG